MRARHTTPRYQREMLDRLKAQNRHALLVRYCKHILSVRRGPKFRREMQNSRRILERQK